MDVNIALFSRRRHRPRDHCRGHESTRPRGGEIRTPIRLPRGVSGRLRHRRHGRPLSRRDARHLPGCRRRIVRCHRRPQVRQRPQGPGTSRTGTAAHAQIAGTVRQPAPHRIVRHAGQPLAAQGRGGARHRFHLRARTDERHLFRPAAGAQRSRDGGFRHLHLHAHGDRTRAGRRIPARHEPPAAPDGRGQGQRARNLAPVAGRSRRIWRPGTPKWSWNSCSWTTPRCRSYASRPIST